MAHRTRPERPAREKLDEALEMTFPASDPVAVTPDAGRTERLPRRGDRPPESPARGRRPRSRPGR